MKKTPETTAKNSLNQPTETLDAQKAWKTPELKILPVPAKTQGGPFKDLLESPLYDEPSA